MVYLIKGQLSVRNDIDVASLQCLSIGFVLVYIEQVRITEGLSTQ